MAGLKVDGDFSKTKKWLEKAKKGPDLHMFEKYGEMGVLALQRGTPVDTGLTASSWTYDVEKSREGIKVNFYNTNVNKGVNIAIILQYGHATRTGGWVQGVDYINPAVRPVLEDLAKEAWEEVKRI